MKNNKTFISIFIICLFIISACSNIEDIDSNISAVQEAVEKSAQLKNGEFTYTNIVENNNEKQSQSTEGTFVVLADSVDWHTKLLLSGADSNTKSISEVIQKDKIQYNRIGILNKENQFIGNEGEILTEAPEWQKVNEDATDYPDVLKSFMNLELNTEDIDTAEVKEENNVTIYEFTYNEPYLSSMKQNNISDLKGTT